ncbi:MAG TPA: alanine--tRNA ligase [Candidatus Moranbacteria bacterium]|nr:alanine--tRNA ligase [Candidatus Moranbacteria bacterium]HAT74570.1 alanine--tRNA ligase [Candidatus Moranbacteria bacterium]
MLTARDLRQKYLDFFESKGHTIIPSASLVPENDPTALFTTAGMHPLVPYLMGEKHPAGKRLANIQKCIRTNDIDEVGDATHHTFFEMLGNWSLGDYFKKESIEMSWEFLTDKKWLGLSRNRIAVSVFAGDNDAPFDEESYNLWKNIGIPENRIARLPKKNNWWGPSGETGPCGSDTEIFYWAGNNDKIPTGFNDDNNLWVEIWNNVFMEYDKQKDGAYKKLAQKNVDTGMGLERILAAIHGYDDNYRTELFWPIIEKIQELFGKNYNDNQKEFRIIADHIKASVFLLSDSIEPSNKDRGYILRRLIRRAVAIVYINDKNLDSKKIKSIARVVLDIYKDIYQEFKQEDKCIDILEKLSREIRKFRTTIENGLKEFNKGVDPFILFTTYGFPIELTKELANEKGIKIDESDFNKKLKKHQELSRTASAGMFKGGLADEGEITTKYHTATHLLLAALREILKPAEIYQKGSNINAERLRFDFNYPEKLTAEHLKRVEDLVNQKIQEKIPVEIIEMPKNEAMKIAKISFDPAKYSDIVKVYKINEFSIELCGGPHVKNTGEIGKFKITKEESSSAGIRRIKAVVE